MNKVMAAIVCMILVSGCHMDAKDPAQVEAAKKSCLERKGQFIQEVNVDHTEVYNYKCIHADKHKIFNW